MNEEVSSISVRVEQASDRFSSNEYFTRGIQRRGMERVKLRKERRMESSNYGVMLRIYLEIKSGLIPCIC